MSSAMHCQKCRTPLRLDGSLEGLNTAAYDVLVGAMSQPQAIKTTTGNDPASSLLSPPQNQKRKSMYDHISQNATRPTFKRHGSGGVSDSTMMSFILLTESQMVQPAHEPPEQQSQQAQARPRRRFNSDKTASPTPPTQAKDDTAAAQADERIKLNKLFDILSARSDIDHPVCVECSELLVAGLRRRLEDATAERDAYVRFLKEHGADDTDQATDEELRAQEESLRRARTDEADARAALVRLEGEKAAVDTELRALEEEARALDEQEERFWRDRNAFAAQLQEFQGERDSVNTRFDHDAQLYERLIRTNVHNDTFSISHDGTYGTINGLRLGRLASVPVDWPEINAAWGHALLLLVTVADKLGYKFAGYEPKPMGSTSRIWRHDAQGPSPRSRGSVVAPPPKKTVLELYSSGDMLGLIGMNRSLNAAMVAFLELVRQLGVFVNGQTKTRGRALDLPYPIEGDKINDLSIKLSISGDETWTKACKLTLTCCKFLLAHASNMGSVAVESAATPPR